MKKFILNLFFTFACFNHNFINCMLEEKSVSNDNEFKPFGNLDKELTLLILEQCFDSNDLFDYFFNASKMLKSIRLIDKSFDKLTKILIYTIKRIACERFIRDASILKKARSILLYPGQKIDDPKINEQKINDQKLLESELRQLFSDAYSIYKDKKKIDEVALTQRAAELLIAGANPQNITITYRPVQHIKVQISILQFIARTNLFTKLIPILQVYKVDINEQDTLGNTALHSAISCPNNEAIKILSRCGANVNIQNNDGDTVLHSLANKINQAEQRATDTMTNPYVKIMHALLGAHCNLSLENNQEKTVIDILAKYEGEDKLLKMIVPIGDLNALNQEGEPVPLVSKFIEDFIAEYYARG